MKKAICFLISIFIFTVTTFANNLEVSDQYSRTCYMNMNAKEIFVNSEQFETKYSFYDVNGYLMIPLNTLFSFAGLNTVIDSENKEFITDIGNSKLYINGKNKMMCYGDYKYRMIAPTIFTNDECFVALNDVIGIIEYDEINKCIFLSVGSDFEAALDNHFVQLSKQRIITATLDEDCIYKDDIPINIGTEIYNNNGYLMLPVRTMFSVFCRDAEITWNEKNKIANITLDDTSIELDYISQKIYMNSIELYYLDYPLDIKDNRLFLPLRLLQAIKILSEYDIYYDDTNKTAYMRI